MHFANPTLELVAGSTGSGVKVKVGLPDTTLGAETRGDHDNNALSPALREKPSVNIKLYQKIEKSRTLFS